MQSLFRLLILLSLFPAPPATDHAWSQPADYLSIDSLVILTERSPREYAFTNKQNLFYYSETGSFGRSGWHGLWIGGRRVLAGFELLIDGKAVSAPEALAVAVFPDYVEYRFAPDLRIQLRLVDHSPLFGIHIFSGKGVEAGIRFRIPDNISRSQVTLRTAGASIDLSDQQGPSFLVINGKGFSPSFTDETGSPLLLYAPRRKEHIISVSGAPARATATSLSEGYQIRWKSLAAARRKRLQDLLDLSPVRTSHRSFDVALAWAKVSVDALVMDDGRMGIYAGLPWFNNYWGRDTFISLPGALLVTGQFAEAKEILRSFAALQETDSSSSLWGRIPNVVNPGDVAYNTADGTPRFVIQAREYTERSGDMSFLPEIFPAVFHSIEGTLRYHTDSLGFLVHGDAETWMDAVGPAGPWSPRGNRANDVQALWLAQLESGIWFAARIGDQESASRWKGIYDQLIASFRGYFIRDGRVIDHLNQDGSADTQVRPNQIFASRLLDSRSRAGAIREVTTRITYPHGVGSLSPEDPQFHPFHLYPPYYPKDAAYHNGIVWTWLQGPLISELCRTGMQDFAFLLTEASIDQILHDGAVGTQSELIDALPRPGEVRPRLSGTFSQAWNLAEFIRNVYDDYLGIRVNRLDHFLTFNPRLPEQLNQITAVVNIGGRRLPVAVRTNETGMHLSIDGTELKAGGTASFSLPLGPDSLLFFDMRILPEETITLRLGNDGRISPDGSGVLNVRRRAIPEYPLLRDLHFVSASYSDSLPVLRGPTYPMIPHTTVRRVNERAGVVLKAQDPVYDDNGDGSYTYPLSPHFLPGSFDLTGIEINRDDSLAYVQLSYRALSDPGWHPEYGYQLTHTAVALGRGTTGQEAGHNSQFVIDSGFDRLIVIGGGIQIEDGNGTILAAYIPSEEDVRDPIGQAAEGIITFALPLKYLGNSLATGDAVVLVGGQDDHGGAGLGEFRSVRPVATEWSGGGKTDPGQPNVYDFLVVPPAADR